MPIKVKDSSRSAAKWSERTSGATQEYIEGVQNPKRPWQEAAKAGSDNWKAGTAKAASEDRFKKGVERVDPNKQMDAAVAKGSQRFAQGVSVGQGDYQEGIAPYLRVIENTTLPPRGPKGDPNNLQRVGVLNKALNTAKKNGVR